MNALFYELDISILYIYYIIYILYFIYIISTICNLIWCGRYKEGEFFATSLPLKLCGLSDLLKGYSWTSQGSTKEILHNLPDSLGTLSLGDQSPCNEELKPHGDIKPHGNIRCWFSLVAPARPPPEN